MSLVLEKPQGRKHKRKHFKRKMLVENESKSLVQAGTGGTSDAPFNLPCSLSCVQVSEGTLHKWDNG